MKLEAARIDTGEKVLTQPRNQNPQRSETGDEESHQEYGPVAKNNPKKPMIAFAEVVKSSFETLLHSDE
jgi:hypothetical protein